MQSDIQSQMSQSQMSQSQMSQFQAPYTRNPKPGIMKAAVYKENGILYGPAKAANAGGVAVSALEMSQNSQRLSWTREEVDGRLKDIMTNIFNTAKTTAETYGLGKDYLAGANIAAFENVANAMIAQGLV